MTDENENMPYPVGPCSKCMSTMALPLPDGRVAVWCKHSSAGSVFEPAVGLWRTFNPIGEWDFARAVLGAEVVNKILTKWELRKNLN